MKTMFDKATRDELINRIHSLNESSTSLWGEMNVYQMLSHCAMWQGMIFGNIKCKRVFLGRIFGKIALKNELKADSILKKSTPTSPELRVKEKDGSLEIQKTKWIVGIESYSNYSNNEFIHPFFGKMTREQVGYFAYKHNDHHLRQFGV